MQSLDTDDKVTIWDIVLNVTMLHGQLLLDKAEILPQICDVAPL
jgi:hypothetical protein